MFHEELKRKIKHLKQAEIAIRFRRDPARSGNGAHLVWSEFFSVKPGGRHAARYSLEELERLDPAQLKAVIDDYFCFVYYQFYRENGLSFDSGYGYDPHLLELMGLPPHAGSDDIKKRFRELAKKYHPDTGGDSQSFIELVDVYNRLTRK